MSSIDVTCMSLADSQEAILLGLAPLFAQHYVSFRKLEA